MIYGSLASLHRTPSLLKASPKGEGFHPSPSLTLIKALLMTDLLFTVYRCGSMFFNEMGDGEVFALSGVPAPVSFDLCLPNHELALLPPPAHLSRPAVRNRGEVGRR